MKTKVRVSRKLIKNLCELRLQRQLRTPYTPTVMYNYDIINEVMEHN